MRSADRVPAGPRPAAPRAARPPAVAACPACLRRAWLVARLAPHLARARERGRRLPLVLGLGDEELLAALGGAERPRIAGEREAFDAGRAAAGIAAAGLGAVCRCDSRYPAALLGGPDAPAVLHVLASGAPDPLARLAALTTAPCVAVVGARRASPDGLAVARALGRGLSAAGVTVVSGLALGIDGAAHAGALEAGGRTLAVLAGGAERAYPASRRALHRRLGEVAAVASEMPPGTDSWRWAFPARNRVIAGVATLTVVVEGTERSGSLITAGLAEDLGRDVAAVPGRVSSPLAAGPNALLKAGAHLVRDAADVLDLIFGAGAWEAPPRADGPPLGPALAALLEEIASGRDTVGRLVAAGRRVDEALTGLAELELRGAVHRAAGGRIVVVPR